jgi:uncharacterized protein (TIGR02646 family)
MRATLAREQKDICCYCNGSIAAGNFHIEHFCPRDADHSLTYVWANLLASCQGGAAGLIRTRRHCGDAKANWFEAGVTVNPTLRGVEALFRFPLTGKIFPAKNLDAAVSAAVELTIDHLHLDAPSLVERREAMLRLAGGDVSNMDRHAWKGFYLGEHDGRLQEFWPALSYNYTKLWSALF